MTKLEEALQVVWDSRTACRRTRSPRLLKASH